METLDSGIGFPDLAPFGGGETCRPRAYQGHTGTDIFVSSVDDRMPVLSAADGTVIWVEDGHYDRCPAPGEPDCRPGSVPLCTASAGSWGPDTTLNCRGGACNCLWGFNAGNFVLVRHDLQGVAFTLYAHLRRGSVRVTAGQAVRRGARLAEVGSSGNAARPHLHFGVWRSVVGSLEPVNPWDDGCSEVPGESLWSSYPPYLSELMEPSVPQDLKVADILTEPLADLLTALRPVCRVQLLP
jgi:murein DD-endopeptidase MepM/ murein hydrolase activator NlpD